MLSAPGDRNNNEVANLAKIAAKNSDLLVIKEDRELRGRAPFEIAGIMRDAAIQEGIGSENIYIIRNELAAFAEAWELSREGDLLLFSYEEFSSITQFLSMVHEKQTILNKKRSG
ncbi:hypothetical protein [Bacillus methanolicus]|uniref:hypothetical protein n=1 Tax=Bacillus methanolicus TaxID=1471 RepID=UPI000AF14482|nr:hypothetical protein [Bacillus methanolicus]